MKTHSIPRLLKPAFLLVLLAAGSLAAGYSYAGQLQNKNQPRPSQEIKTLINALAGPNHKQAKQELTHRLFLGNPAVYNALRQAFLSHEEWIVRDTAAVILEIPPPAKNTKPIKNLFRSYTKRKPTCAVAFNTKPSGPNQPPRHHKKTYTEKINSQPPLALQTKKD